MPAFEFRGRFDIAYLCEEFNSTGSKFDIEGTAQFLSIFSQSLTVNTRANLTGDFDVVVLSLGSAEADLSEAQFGRLAEINYCGRGRSRCHRDRQWHPVSKAGVRQ